MCRCTRTWRAGRCPTRAASLTRQRMAYATRAVSAGTASTLQWSTTPPPILRCSTPRRAASASSRARGTASPSTVVSMASVPCRPRSRHADQSCARWQLTSLSCSTTRTTRESRAPPAPPNPTYPSTRLAGWRRAAIFLCVHVCTRSWRAHRRRLLTPPLDAFGRLRTPSDAFGRLRTLSDGASALPFARPQPRARLALASPSPSALR